MEPAGLRLDSKIEIFDFAGYTIIADFSPIRKSHAPGSTDGECFFIGSSPIFSGDVRGLFIGR